MIWTILKTLIPGAWKWLAAAGAAVLSIAGIYLKGRADAKAKADMRDLKGFKKTTERIQDADAAMGDDPAALREWLRKRDADKP